jgi:hypothetical protein
METLATTTHVPTYLPPNLIPGYIGAISNDPYNNKRLLRNPQRDTTGALLLLAICY